MEYPQASLLPPVRRVVPGSERDCAQLIGSPPQYGILSTLVLARASCGYQQRLQGKVGKLEEAIKARRLIEKAIRILMDAHRLAENDAYEHMRSRATSLRVTVGAIATMVIDAHEAMEKLGFGKAPKS